MLCGERDSLLERFQKYLTQYIEAMMRLKTTKGTKDFDSVQMEVRLIRTECDRAKAALESHRDEHGC
jgi:hypothetical protein